MFEYFFKLVWNLIVPENNLMKTLNMNLRIGECSFLDFENQFQAHKNVLKVS